jgi:hypothetical protein
MIKNSGKYELQCTSKAYLHRRARERDQHRESEEEIERGWG